MQRNCSWCIDEKTGKPGKVVKLEEPMEEIQSHRDQEMEIVVTHRCLCCGCGYGHGKVTQVTKEEER